MPLHTPAVFVYVQGVGGILKLCLYKESIMKAANGCHDLGGVNNQSQQARRFAAEARQTSREPVLAWESSRPATCLLAMSRVHALLIEHVAAGQSPPSSLTSNS